MVNLNRLVFGASANAASESSHSGSQDAGTFHLPFTCRLVLILAAVPVLVLGVYVPKPLHDLLTLAAAALTR
jgi:hypothetical protein